VIVCERVNHLSMYSTAQVNSAFYPVWDGKMSFMCKSR